MDLTGGGEEMGGATGAPEFGDVVSSSSLLKDCVTVGTAIVAGQRRVASVDMGENKEHHWGRAMTP